MNIYIFIKISVKKDQTFNKYNVKDLKNASNY